MHARKEQINSAGDIMGVTVGQRLVLGAGSVNTTLSVQGCQANNLLISTVPAGHAQRCPDA